MKKHFFLISLSLKGSFRYVSLHNFFLGKFTWLFKLYKVLQNVALDLNPHEFFSV